MRSVKSAAVYGTGSRSVNKHTSQLLEANWSAAQKHYDMDDFTAGVVEGFYGVPWTADQRRILFGWMQKMGLNTYMYAPKDDCKHRAYWRELYSVEEAENLTGLIESAHEKGVTFVYAISPGLDITFSSSKDVQALKRKLEQVAAFGCHAFAILFDDIDPQLSEADQGMFSSSACAQSSITNELYEHLGQPKFLYCPTEYCASRAVPNVLSSDYLKTLGSKLLPGIDIMWTGCKVISKKITVKALEDISVVLKRAPVIWDNIHANDYDPRRIFLGPYEGRSPEIIPYIKGVMTNPNCEFEANYISCHTLGQWCRSNPNGVKKDFVAHESCSSVATDIRLEMQSEYGSDEDVSCIDVRYRPRQALKSAISEWLVELTSKRDPPKRKLPSSPTTSSVAVAGVPPGVPSTSEIVLNSIANIVSTPLDSALVEYSIETSPFINPSFLQPQALSQPVNSLVADSSAESSDCSSDVSSLYSCDTTEPMECVQSSTAVPVISNLNVLKSELEPESSAKSADCVDAPMQVEDLCATCSQSQCAGHVITPSLVTQEDVALMVDLFYLPFEHGSGSLQLLHDLHWLMANVHDLRGAETSKISEWKQRLHDFETIIQKLDILLMRLFLGPNKAVLCDLYAYLWDLKGVLGICLAFTKWLELACFVISELSVVCNTTTLMASGFATWFSKGYREAFTSGDQEPWVFRGGLQAELQRLMPICTATDLFLVKTPDWVIQRLYNIRPYRQEDESAVYDICLKTCDDGMDGSQVFSEYPGLLGDRLIGNFVTLSPEYCFVTEDEEGVCGYVMAAQDAQILANKSNESWVPAMQSKYCRPAIENLTPAEEIVLSFHTNTLDVHEQVYKLYPSVLRLDVLVSRLHDPAIPSRLLASALCALKASGSKGVHTKLNSGDKFMMDFYSKLGFFPVQIDSQKKDVVYLGRLL